MVLGIETTTDRCEVALVHEGRVTAERGEEAPRAHSSVLMTMVEAVMREAGVDGKNLAGLAVSQGPGSFTGLRVGLSLAKGLAYGWRVPLVGIPTLEILAHQSLTLLITFPLSLIAVLIDAKRGEVYDAVYRYGNGEVTAEKSPGCESPLRLAEWMAARPPEAVMLTGDGLKGDRGWMKALGEVKTTPEETWPPRAATVARLGEAAIRAGRVPSLAALAPLYLREPNITSPKPR